MATRKEIETAYQAAKDKLGREPNASEVLSIGKVKASDRWVRTILAQLRPKPEPKAPVKPTAKSQGIISEKELLMAHDPVTRFRAAIKARVKSFRPGQFLKDSQLRRECGSSVWMVWQEACKDPELSPHLLEMGTGTSATLYWGHPESVASIIDRGEGNAHKPDWAEVDE